MASIMRTFFVISWYRRMAPIIGILFLTFFITQYGFCVSTENPDSKKFAQGVFNNVKMRDETLLIQNFDVL